MKTDKKSKDQSWSSNNLKNKDHTPSPTVKQGGTVYGSVKGATDINDDDLIVNNSSPPQEFKGERKFPDEQQAKEISEGLGAPEEEKESEDNRG